MRYFILSSLWLSFLATLVQGNIQLNSYHISAAIIPENKSIDSKADINLSVDPECTDSLVFYLHKEFSIVEIKSKTKISFCFKTGENSPYFWMKDARPLCIKIENNKAKNIDIQIVYRGSIADLSWKTTNMISEPWIELGNYSAWFPTNPDYGKFNYSVILAIDPSHKVTGMGKIEKVGENWEIHHTKPTNDIVIIASKELKTIYSGENSNSIRLDYVSYNEENADKTIKDVEFIVSYYNNWFNTSYNVQFTIVIVPPFSNRGSYHRDNFMALLQPEPGANISFSLIAHEVAHEWWHGAPTDTFEDWLNESFAEYASLKAIRAKYGKDRFEEWIKYKDFSSREAPPILQSNSNARAPASTLYNKGPLILYKLEQRIGEGLFQKFLNELLLDNVKSTDRLLKLLEEMTSSEIRLYFESELRN
jgi:hypothetical protein